MVRIVFSCALSALLILTAHARADVTMTANPCYQVGDLLVVEIHKGVTPVAVVGGQFFLTYDTSKVTYVGGLAGDPPFTFTVLDHVSGSSIDYAVGVPGFGPGTAADRVIARLVFKPQAEVCADDHLLVFRPHNPPSRLTDNLGNEVSEPMHDLGLVTIDSTAPTITCQGPVTVSADPGYCSHTFAAFPPATATDNCGATVTYTRYIGLGSIPDTVNPSVFDPFSTGSTRIVWSATDCSGNVDTCDQTVTVLTTTDLLATVRVAGAVPTTFNRCITFELRNTSACPAPPTIVEAEMTFSGGISSAVVPVPCGAYDCITARDRLHSLRRTANVGHFGPTGPAFFCYFISDINGDDSLLGGNVNDDFVVDILDFGGLIGQFGHAYSVSTNCATAMVQADFDGNGLVDIDDYSFISAQFLVFREPDCCGVPLLGEGSGVSDISVFALADMGKWEIARTADLNHDGRLNAGDVAFMFEHGAPPCVADFNGLGGTGIDDIFAYLNSWFARHPACDVNDDHAVNIDDLFGFLNIWMTGCN